MASAEVSWTACNILSLYCVACYDILVPDVLTSLYQYDIILILQKVKFPYLAGGRIK